MSKTIKSPVVLEPDEDLSIAENEEYVAAGQYSMAVDGQAGGGHYVRVAGTARADYGIYLGHYEDVVNNAVEIASTGRLNGGFSALEMTGGTNIMVNHGLLESTGGVAFYIYSTANLGSSVITNTGTITGDIGMVVATSDVVRFNNSGSVEGNGVSYSAGGNIYSHIDRITNTGNMIGDIHLDDMDDVYNGKSGMVTGPSGVATGTTDSPAARKRTTCRAMPASIACKADGERTSSLAASTQIHLSIPQSRIR